MKVLFFDLETTGLNPAKNGIHQISGIIEVDGEIKETFNFKVQPNPKSIIESEALKIANVTTEQVNAYPPMLEVHKQFTELLGKYCDKFNKSDKFHLCGYNNASFDNNFLRGFFLQNGDNYFGSWFWSDSIDVMVLASYFLISKRHQMPDFKLKTVAKTLGIEVEESKLHDAFYDIELTKQIYDKIYEIIWKQ
jgi:DNA polymerase-3 subunit epsilon